MGMAATEDCVATSNRNRWHSTAEGMMLCETVEWGVRNQDKIRLWHAGHRVVGPEEMGLNQSPSPYHRFALGLFGVG
jgi:hypothetical protein